MSDGMNRVTLFGGLTADPELRYTPGGQPVLNMRLATTETYLDKDKQRKETTEYHAVVLWGKRGEALAKFLTKGTSLLVEGSLRTSSYEKDGQKRYKTEIVAKEVYLGNRKGGPSERPEGGYGTSGAGASAKHTSPDPMDRGGPLGDDAPPEDFGF